MALTDDIMFESGRSGDSSVVRPTRCAGRIGQVQRRWRLLHRSSALSVLIAWAMVSGAALVGVDWYFRGGHAARTVLLAVFAGGLVHVLKRRVMPRWKSLPAEKAALLIEGTYPDLGGRLVTAVQLASAQARQRSGASHDLYGAVCTRAESSTGDLDPRHILPGRPHLWRAAAAWLAVGAVTALVAFSPAGALIGAQRLLLPWSRVEWPRRTHIELARPAEGPFRVVRGGTLVLEGRVTGAVPATGSLTVDGGSGATDRAYFDIGGDGWFTVRYRPVTTDLVVTPAAGDASLPPLEVEVVPPPEIAAIQAECESPEYTRLPVRRLADGNVQAVFGSQVRLRVTASKPVTEALLAWDDGKTVPLKRIGTSEAQAEFRVEASRSYRIHLTDSLGFHNDQPVLYRIEMVDNAYPRFDRVTPAADKRVTARAILPITAQMADDFGVTEATLCYRTGKGEPQRVPISIDRPGPRASIAYSWALEGLSLRPGASIEYWMEARDAGEHAVKSKWPVSRPHRLHIVDEAELARQLGEQLEQTFERLAQLEGLQEECADAVQRIAQSATSRPASATGPAGTAEHTRAEKWRQDRIARTAAQLAERLSLLIEDYAISRLGEAPRLEQLRQVARAIAQLAGTDMPAIVLALDQAAAGVREAGLPATQPREDHP